MRNSDGELALGESHIMCNLFSINALEKIASKTLPYHVAIKKVECYKDGKLVDNKIGYMPKELIQNWIDENK